MAVLSWQIFRDVGLPIVGRSRGDVGGDSVIMTFRWAYARTVLPADRRRGTVSEERFSADTMNVALGQRYNLIWTALPPPLIRSPAGRQGLIMFADMTE